MLEKAQFEIGAADLSQLPPDRGREVAFAGRSNAGKSSAINALTNRRRLAFVSKTPGRTQQINFYALGAGRYLVDLPGYGYARGGESAARAFETLTTDYFSSGLVDGAILAVDGRHPGLASDRAAFAWLEEHGMPLVLVATKIDCLTRTERRRALDSFATSFHAPVVPASAVTGEGLDDLWKLIAKMASRPRP